jgi:hypothetical protein
VAIRLIKGYFNAPGQIRTDDLRFRKPKPKNHKHLQQQTLTENTKSDLARFSSLLTPNYPDLAQVVERWAGLPEHIKQTIKTLVEL